jgi:predicted permease
MRVRDLTALGMSEAEARTEALRRFGDLEGARCELVRETRHRIRRNRWSARTRDLIQDAGLALRGFRHRPGFAAVAVFTLALGLGLTTAVLAVVNRLVVNPLPYPGAERLASVWLASDQTAMRISPQFHMLGVWRARSAGAEWIEAYEQEERLLEGGETAELVQTRSVTPGLLPALGARIAVGRGIQPSDTAADAPLVTLLSWSSWEGRFSRSPGAIGQSIRLNGNLVIVVGVVEPGFDLTSIDGSARAEFWLPLGGPWKGEESVSILLLRRPGSSAAAVTAELRAGLRAEDISSEMLEKFPPTAFDTGDSRDGNRERTLWLLTLAVGLVLAVACANVAALLIGQTSARNREFGVRSALGAGRGRIVRQLLTEAGLLAVSGNLAGVLVARAAFWLTRRYRPDNLLTLDEVAIDPGVTLVTLGVTFLVAILFGLVPALVASRTDAAATLGGRIARSFDTRIGRSLRSVLVVGQLAAGLVLVNGAGLLIRSFVAQRNQPIGLEPENLGWIDLRISRRTVPEPAARDAISARVLAAVKALPGVETAALAGDSPLGYGIMEAEFLIDGRGTPEAESRTMIPFRAAGPGYFETIGMRMDAGNPMDARSGSNEIVIDRVTARRFFPNGDAIGSRIRFERTAEWHTVVGITAEERTLFGGFPDAPFVYVAPTPGERGGALVLRTHPDLSLQRVSAVIRSVDSRVQIRSVQRAEEVLDDRLAARRFTMTIVTVFAGFALLLAAVGLYGVVAMTVNQRTYELGVRMALGAAPSRVRLMVLRQGGRQVATGILVGFLLVAGMGRLLEGLLSGVGSWDPVVWVTATLVLAAAGIFACWVPARRASRVDPIQALRSD